MNKSLVIKVKDVINFKKDLELDLSNFIEFFVGTKNIDESNLFLNSLWREFNANIAPNGLLKCPWAYLPQKHIYRKSIITYFGSMRCKLGYVHVAISYKTKGCIDNILFFISENNIEEHKRILKRLVKLAKKNINLRFKYKIEYELIGKYQNHICNKLLCCYSGKNFNIDTKENVNNIMFYVNAQDMFDAERIAQRKILQIVNFLAVETNIYFEYYNLDISLEVIENNKNINQFYQEDISINNDCFVDGNFIDFYPEYEEKVLLSRKGVNFIDIITDTSFECDEKTDIFLSSCYHFRQGIEREYNLEEIPSIVSKEYIMTYSKTNQPKRQGILDVSLMLYLSAIETTTLIDRKIEKCDKCGQLKFEIRKSVCDFINKYLWNTHGELFKKIYDLRSQYLHKGKSIYTSNLITIRPLLDDKTATGCIDVGFTSMDIHEVTTCISINNIREWTSYSLRNFYKRIILKN